jgi:HNH endonuclease
MAAWTLIQLNNLRKFFPFSSLADTAKKCRHTQSASKQKAGYLGLTKKVKFYRTTWSREETQFLIDNYCALTSTEIAHLLDKKIHQVKNHVHRLGISLPESEKQIRKMIGAFKKGSIPITIGKKWDEYMSKEAQERSRSTCFKLGQLPKNTKETDGVITKRYNRKEKRWHFHIRISLGKWEFLHKYNWEKTNGPLPAGAVLRFRDGNTLNCEPTNLELIDKQENMRRNTIHRYPEALKDVIRLQSKLTKKIKRYEKQDH